MKKALFLSLFLFSLRASAAETYSAYEDESTAYGPPTPSNIRVQGAVASPKKAVHAKKVRANAKPKLTALTQTPAPSKPSAPSNAKRIEKLEAEVQELRKSISQANAPLPAAPAVLPRTEPPSTAYDPVPSDQVSALLKRLEITKKLVSIHGRAYDYRAMTTQQLENALTQLEGRAPQRKKRSSAPRVQQPAQDDLEPAPSFEGDEVLPEPPFASESGES